MATNAALLPSPELCQHSDSRCTWARRPAWRASGPGVPVCRPAGAGRLFTGAGSRRALWPRLRSPPLCRPPPRQCVPVKAAGRGGVAPSVAHSRWPCPDHKHSLAASTRHLAVLHHHRTALSTCPPRRHSGWRTSGRLFPTTAGSVTPDALSPTSSATSPWSSASPRRPTPSTPGEWPPTSCSVTSTRRRAPRGWPPCFTGPYFQPPPLCTRLTRTTPQVGLGPLHRGPGHHVLGALRHRPRLVRPRWALGESLAPPEADSLLLPPPVSAATGASARTTR